MKPHGTRSQLMCNHAWPVHTVGSTWHFCDALGAGSAEPFTRVPAMLATPPSKEKLKSGEDRLQIEKLSDKDVLQLEYSMDHMNEVLPEMTHFILPGGNSAVSFCHIARTVCRRAERMIVKLADEEPVLPIIITYINRLSDYLFVLARKLTFDQHAEEIKWISR